MKAFIGMTYPKFKKKKKPRTVFPGGSVSLLQSPLLLFSNILFSVIVRCLEKSTALSVTEGFVVFHHITKVSGSPHISGNASHLRATEAESADIVYMR